MGKLTIFQWMTSQQRAYGQQKLDWVQLEKRENEVKRGIKGLDPKGGEEMEENAIEAQYKIL